jgi:Fic family protein
MILKEGITIGEKPLIHHLEAIGHRDAWGYVADAATSRQPLSERIIKDIHALVLMNDRENRGCYRRVPVTISGAAVTPPQPYLIEPQMERLISDYQDMLKTMHIINAASEFHLCFEAIHPFIDGNGRTGRLILNLELIKAGLLPVNIKYTDRRRYYNCFDDYQTSGSSDTLAELLAGYEREELIRYIGIIAGEYTI